MARRAAPLRAAGSARNAAWCFPPSLSREQATALLKRAGNTAGLFLLRSKSTAGPGTTLALSVVEKPGEVFHHLLELPGAGEQVMLNGKPAERCVTLNQTIALLSRTQPQLNWPIGLTLCLCTDSMTPRPWVPVHDAF